MRPTEILDAQADLLERLRFNQMFKRQLSLACGAAMAQYHMRDDQHGVPEDGALSETHVKAGVEFIEHITRQVENGYAYRVTPQMVDLVDHVARQLDDSDRWDWRMPPTPAGFCRFDKPIKVTEMRGETMLVHFAVWGPAGVRMGNRGNEEVPTTCYQFFNDLWTEPDEAWTMYGPHAERNEYTDGVDPERSEQYLRELGRWASTCVMLQFDGERVGPPVVQERTPEEFLKAGIAAAEPTTNLGRHMYALFFLLNQTIAQVEEEFPDRAGLRRAQKRLANVPPKVSVIKLRRAEQKPSDGMSNVEWQHQWLVRGHLRWQPYGTRADDHAHDLSEPVRDPETGHMVKICLVHGCNHYRARIYINPYFKGPEDAPLIVTDKLYDLCR